MTETLNKLTIEEKIGQMMQLVTDLFGTNDAQGVFHIDPAKADTLFSKYKIGSILNAPNTCAPTAQQWQEIIADIQELSMKHIGIPCLFGLDQNHGVTYTQGHVMPAGPVSMRTSARIATSMLRWVWHRPLVSKVKTLTT